MGNLEIEATRSVIVVSLKQVHEFRPAQYFLAHALALTLEKKLLLDVDCYHRCRLHPHAAMGVCECRRRRDLD